MGELREEGATNFRQVGYITCLIFVWVEPVIYKNKYMPMHVAEIYRMDRGGFGLAAVRFIVVATENDGALRDSKISMG